VCVCMCVWKTKRGWREERGIKPGVLFLCQGGAGEEC